MFSFRTLFSFIFLDTPLLEVGVYVDRPKLLRHFDLVLVRLADLINIFQALLNRDDSTKESIESLYRRLNEIQLTAQVHKLFVPSHSQLVETVHWFLTNRILPLRNKSLLGQLSDIVDNRRTDRINGYMNAEILFSSSEQRNLMMTKMFYLSIP